ncbi:MAG: PduL/EutD family phosphate acyltransferase [Flavonifractor plautii]
MEQIVSAVMDAVHRAGLVEVEVSARHVHLSQADVEVLFGPGARLEPKRRSLSRASSCPSSGSRWWAPRAGRRVAVLGPAARPPRWSCPRATAWSWGSRPRPGVRRRGRLRGHHH